MLLQQEITFDILWETQADNYDDAIEEIEAGKAMQCEKEVTENEYSEFEPDAGDEQPPLI